VVELFEGELQRYNFEEKNGGALGAPYGPLDRTGPPPLPPRRYATDLLCIAPL